MTRWFQISILWHPRIHCSWVARKPRVYQNSRLVDAWRFALRDDGWLFLSSCYLAFPWPSTSSTQTGLPPFYDENVNTMYQRILTDPLNFPLDMPPEAKSVMTGLLQRDPAKRLGSNGGEEIKRHPFFAKYIDWNRYARFFSSCSLSSIECLRSFPSCRLLAKKIQPPFKPSVVCLSLFLLGFTDLDFYVVGIGARRCQLWPRLYERRGAGLRCHRLRTVRNSPGSVQRVYLQSCKRAPQRERDLREHHGVERLVTFCWKAPCVFCLVNPNFCSLLAFGLNMFWFVLPPKSHVSHYVLHNALLWRYSTFLSSSLCFYYYRLWSVIILIRELYPLFTFSFKKLYVMVFCWEMRPWYRIVFQPLGSNGCKMVQFWHVIQPRLIVIIRVLTMYTAVACVSNVYLCRSS